MATSPPLPLPRAVFYDANGNPLAGGFVYTYVPGGSVPKTTWQDAGETTPNSNPIDLDAGGSCLIYGSGNYQLTVTDSLGNAIPAYSGLTSAPTFYAWVPVASISVLRASTVTSLPQTQAFLLGYYATADGGEGPFVYISGDTTSPDNGGTIIIDASGRRWRRESQGVPLTIRQFGAKGDGVADDLASILNCIAAVVAGGGGVVLFPPGNFLTSNSIATTASNIWLRGSGKGATTITCNFASGDIVSIGSSITNPNDCTVSDMTITSAVSKTLGAAIRFTNGHDLTIRDVQINWNIYIGLDFDGGASQYIYRVQDFEINSGSLAAIRVGATAEVQDLFVLNGSIANSTIGILLINLGGFTISKVDIILGSVGVRTLPVSPNAVTSGVMEWVLADTMTDMGWQIWTGGGLVSEVVFNNCWASTCGQNTGLDGFNIDQKTGGINGLVFNAPLATNNVGNGINVISGKQVHINEPIVGGNSTAGSGTWHGISFAANITEFSVIGGFSGLGGFFPTNLQGYGVIVQSGTSDQYVISLVNAHGNVTGSVSDGGSGVNKFVGNNIT